MSATSKVDLDKTLTRPAHLSTLPRNLWVDHVNRKVADYMSAVGYVTTWDPLYVEPVRPLASDAPDKSQVYPRPARVDVQSMTTTDVSELDGSTSISLGAQNAMKYADELKLHHADMAAYEKALTTHNAAVKTFQEFRTLQTKALAILQSFMPTEEWEAIKQHPDFGKEPTVLGTMRIIDMMFKNAEHSGEPLFFIRSPSLSDSILYDLGH